ncbi:MAG TPA: alpha/beta fold hydrolase [Bdellovibrionales bacterium]|nr:alpha/beta fold hydrolase [Bdellovibrionales bacterium]
MRKPARLLIVAFLSAASFAAAALAYLYFMQERLVFFPEPLAQDAPLAFGAPHTELFLDLEGGKKLHYLIFSPPEAPAIIVYFHGNGGNLARWGEVAAELAVKSHHEVWIFDYPGYGKSTGPLPPDSDELIQVSREFVKHVKKSRPNYPIVMFGRSLGTGLATKLALTEGAAAVVLESPYTSLKDLAREIYPLVPTALLRYHLDNTELAENKRKMPILIVHGTEDTVIPHHHGENLFKMLKTKAAFLSVSGATHDNLNESDRYWRGLTDFLSAIGL